MKLTRTAFVAIFVLFLIIPSGAMADDPPPDGQAPEKDQAELRDKPVRPRVLMGTPPVNTNMSASGSLPEGVLFTKLNAGFADRNSGVHSYNGSEVMSQTWLVKIRYGLTNRLELAAVVPYINMSRSNPTPSQKHVEGFGDVILGINVAPFNLHQGDPFSLSFVLAAMLPTAQRGANHLSGQGAWGWRVNGAIGTMITPDLKIDTELMGTGPFEQGQNDVHRGNEYQWNTQLRYLFQSFDIGLESSLVWKRDDYVTISPGAGRNRFERSLGNGGTTWWLGPTMNFALPWDMWAGAGVLFPISRGTNGNPQAVEHMRFDFSIGKLF
jgi:hypothetical protein